jgi:hypothetical protein
VRADRAGPDSVIDVGARISTVSDNDTWSSVLDERRMTTSPPPTWLFGASWLRLSAAIEAATGVALIVRPSLVGQLLLGVGLAPAGEIVGRVAGVALLALALACRPVADVGAVTAPALEGMLIYNSLVGLYLAYVGAAGGAIGVLLWPAAAIHLLLAALLAAAWLRR